MTMLSRMAHGFLTVADACAPAASRIGHKLVGFSRWIEDRRIRLAIAAHIAD